MAFVKRKKQAAQFHAMSQHQQDLRAERHTREKSEAATPVAKKKAAKRTAA